MIDKNNLISIGAALLAGAVLQIATISTAHAAEASRL
jgi:hypothetical protein